MQTIRELTPRRSSTRELIDYQDLAFFDHIVYIALQQVVCAKRQVYMMYDLQVFRICQIVYIKPSLGLAYTLIGQIDDIVLPLND